MTEQPWFIARPDWLNNEVQQLEAAGAVVREDVEMKAAGRLRLYIDWPTPTDAPGGIAGAPIRGTIHLIADFPDTYRRFRPAVRAPEVRLPRHVHPDEGLLCLLETRTSNWDPRESLAELLQQQLPLLLNSGVVTDPKAVAANPDEQAEPFSAYFQCARQAPILVDDDFLRAIGSDRSGRIHFGLPDDAGVGSRMAALEISGSNGRINNLPESVARQYPRRFRGAWYRLAETPTETSPDKLLDWARARMQSESISPLDSEGLRVKDGRIRDVMALIFPEEHAPGREGIGIAFIVQFQKRATTGARGKGSPAPIQSYIAPAARVSRSAYQDRIPLLHPLRDKTVVVVGLGTLGAPIAIELGRSGIGRLRLMDCDIVEPPTTVRWPLGLWAAGVPKTVALQKFITANFPHTAIQNHDLYGHRIGFPKLDGSELEQVEILRLLDGADLIVDATAEDGISDLFATVAREHGIPFVSVFGSWGARGGVVMRQLPEHDGCWMCVQHALGDTLPEPPEDKSPTVQTRGCLDPTFTGPGFDLAPLSMEASRMVVATLCRGHIDAYSDLPYDISVLRLVDQEGRPSHPVWSAHPLLRHANCPYCGGAQE